eukprot:11181171-Lingulodinium_polyedra.AAC.1
MGYHIGRHFCNDRGFVGSTLGDLTWNRPRFAARRKIVGVHAGPVGGRGRCGSAGARGPSIGAWAAVRARSI